MVRCFQRVSVWDFSGLKDMFQVLDQSVILASSEEREEATACLSVRRMRDVMAESGVIDQQRDKEDFPENH